MPRGMGVDALWRVRWLRVTVLGELGRFHAGCWRVGEGGGADLGLW